MTNRPTSRQLQGHFDALRARRSNTTAEVIDIAGGNYGSGKTFAGATEVSDPAWVGATATFYVYLDKNDELVLNDTSGFPELSTWIARIVIASGIIIDVIDERASINSFVDGYQVGFDDSNTTVVQGDDVQEALESLDAYVSSLGDFAAKDVVKYLDFDIMGGIKNGNASFVHVDDSPAVQFRNRPNGTSRIRYSASIPADLVDGEDIIVKIFWSAETDTVGDVNWQIRYRSITSDVDSVDSVMTADTFTQSTSGTANLLINTGNELRISYGDISPNDILVLNVERLHSTGDYNSAVRVHLVRLEYIGRGVE